MANIEEFFPNGHELNGKEDHEILLRNMKERREEIKEISGMNYVACGQQMGSAFYNPKFTCAEVNKNVCIPTPICPEPMIAPDKKTKTYSQMLDELSAENKKLTQEKIKLNLKVMELQKQLYDQMKEKPVKEKSVVVENFFADIKKQIIFTYESFIKWLNS